jgi:ribosomal-protein-alanine N-acetyltransferase
VRLRRLAYADLPAVLAIERRSFQTPWSLAMFVLELSKPSSICIAAATENGLAGYLVCSRYADVWHLMNVAVEPDRRRERIANGVAISMYERFGFRAAGHRRRYYHDNGEDALIMWLEREPAPA